MSVSRLVLIAGVASLVVACGPEKKTEGESPVVSNSENASSLSSQKGSATRTAQAKKTACPAGNPASNTDDKVDILGVSAGDSYEKAAAALTCKYPKLSLETGTWHTEHTKEDYGIDTRQRIRVSDGDICSIQAKMSAQQGRGGRCGEKWGGGRLEPRNTGNVTVNVVLTGVPGEEVVHGVWREQIFKKDARPALQAVESALTEKYGEPHDLKKRTYDKKLIWVYDVLGRPMPKENRDFDRCAGNVDPYFYRGQGWRTGCGVTIVAEVTEGSDQPGTTRFLRVAFLDQNNFFESQEQMQADLEEARAAKANTNAEAASSVSLDL